MASIVYFLLWAGLFFIMMRFGCGAHVMGHGHHHGNATPEKDVDPVCHMPVETAQAKTTVYEGHVYHFCSQECRGKFESEPSKYLTSTSS